MEVFAEVGVTIVPVPEHRRPDFEEVRQWVDQHCEFEDELEGLIWLAGIRESYQAASHAMRENATQ